MSILCLVMHVLCVYAVKLLSGIFWLFLRHGLAFSGENRLATLQCVDLTTKKTSLESLFLGPLPAQQQVELWAYQA